MFWQKCIIRKLFWKFERALWKKIYFGSHLRPRWLKDKLYSCAAIKYLDVQDIQKQNYNFCANKNNAWIHNSLSFFVTIILEVYDSLISLKVNRIKLRTHSRIDTFRDFQRVLPPVKIKAECVEVNLKFCGTKSTTWQALSLQVSFHARKVKCWRLMVLLFRAFIWKHQPNRIYLL